MRNSKYNDFIFRGVSQPDPYPPGEQGEQGEGGDGGGGDGGGGTGEGEKDPPP